MCGAVSAGHWNKEMVPGLCLLVLCLLPGLVLGMGSHLEWVLQLPTCSYGHAVGPTLTQAPLTTRSNFSAVIRNNLLGFPGKGMAVLVAAALRSPTASP